MLQHQSSRRDCVQACEWGGGWRGVQRLLAAPGQGHSSPLQHYLQSNAHVRLRAVLRVLHCNKAEKGQGNAL